MRASLSVYLESVHSSAKMGLKAQLMVTICMMALAAAYPVTYVQPGGQPVQSLTPQQYQALVQQAQGHQGAAAYQQQAAPQPAAPVYQPQPQEAAFQPQPQAYQQPQPQPQLRPRIKGLPPQAGGLAQGGLAQGGLAQPEDYDPNPHYQFAFDVKDDEFTNYQNRKEQRDGGKISGSYSVVDSDGFIRTVKYTADPLEGFKAEVTREPTNIVVKIPTPPPALPQQQPQQYSSAPAPQGGQPYAQVYSSVAAQASPQQLAQLRALAKQQFAAPSAAAAAAQAQGGVQYAGVQPRPQIQYNAQPLPSKYSAAPQPAYQPYHQ